MFFPEGQVRVHLYGHPVDMRRGFTGLYALTQQKLRQDPLSGHLFVFISRRGDYLKCLYWDRTGFCLWAKRLERGRLVSDWARAHTRLGSGRIRGRVAPHRGVCRSTKRIEETFGDAHVLDVEHEPGKCVTADRQYQRRPIHRDCY